MILSEKIRNTGFWLADFLRGGTIRKHLKDLDAAFANPEQGKKLADDRLKAFLEHACRTTEFYKQFKDKAIDEFPVIQKKTIKENYNAFLSDLYRREELFKTTTSGSYGMPFTFLLSRDRRARQLAEVIFFSGWAGYQIGMPYAQVRVHPKPWWYLFLQNGILMNPSIIDNVWLEKYSQLLKTGRIHFIIGYPTAINPLAEYCKSKGYSPADFKLKGIISGAENLLDPVRETWKEVFECIVLDRYSSNELGVIAHECIHSRSYHINFASHHIELLKIQSDEPVGPGEIGRVVATDFFSHAMPLIRYDTGDLACWGPPCPCGHDTKTFAKIHGRVVASVFDPIGNLVNFAIIDKIPKDISNIVQFQFIQKSHDTYHVKLHVMPMFNEEQLLKQRFEKVLTSDAKIMFEYVDSIPPLPSGKRPYIINEYLNPPGKKT